MPKYYKGDPYWLYARFAGRCSKCGGQIKKDDRIFYYPKCKTVLCNGENCGQAAAAEFAGAAADEDLMNGGGYGCY